MFEAPREPQDFGKTLDTGFRLFGAGWKGGMLITLYAILALGLIGGAGVATFIPMMDRMDEAFGFAIGMGLILGLLAIFFWLIAMNSLIAWFGAIYRGAPLRVNDAIRIGMNKLFPVFGWYILFFLLLAGVLLPGGIIFAIGIATQEPVTIALTSFLGGVVMLIPYFFVAVLFVFGPYLIVMDDSRATEAFGESKRLVWGNWWRTFAYGAVVMLLVWVISFILSLPLTIVSVVFTFSGEMTGSLITDLLNQLISLLVYPLSVSMTLSYMFDMQLRRSGLDLAARLA